METYEYSVILEADIIKHVENISQEWENYPKPNYIAEI